eukprot:CAMPEP_0202073674 /NCGR_PEP_ID=MMETSP0964-20121228/3175_1 /ASSEMBLY_ACC=CAM_ASM_000500 /TAXON_ID=4773 /ORGANISM="Schizochytrium aggregatum, Strain ATCC28209" /LENGTH=139 /DNA_ID=CAMNT_0048640787 /DNA_START=397 /DNA_END=814 /DNA_ORIENTATION=+
MTTALETEAVARAAGASTVALAVGESTAGLGIHDGVDVAHHRVHGPAAAAEVGIEAEGLVGAEGVERLAEVGGAARIHERPARLEAAGGRAGGARVAVERRVQVRHEALGGLGRGGRDGGAGAAGREELRGDRGIDMAE